MDNSGLLLEPVLPPKPLDILGSRGLDKTGSILDPEKNKTADEAQKKQTAKDFESLLIARILEQMKETIPKSPLAEDGAGEQVESIFWLYLGREIADKGGFGLWKQIYQTMTGKAAELPSEQMVDKKI